MDDTAQSDDMNNMEDTENQFDSNFDAGVKADENTDPKKYIQQLTGKLSETLRKYNKDLPVPDSDLCKYVAGMIVKQAAEGLSPEESKEICKKLTTNSEQPDNDGNDGGDNNDDNENVEECNDNLYEDDSTDSDIEINVGASKDVNQVNPSVVTKKVDTALKNPSVKNAVDNSDAKIVIAKASPGKIPSAPQGGSVVFDKNKPNESYLFTKEQINELRRRSMLKNAKTYNLKDLIKK